MAYTLIGHQRHALIHGLLGMHMTTRMVMIS